MTKRETKSTVLPKHHLSQLKLPTMESECEEIAFRCAKENVDHPGFLLQLSERELLERESKATERRLKAAKFPNMKTLESFDFKAQPSINKMLEAREERLLLRMKKSLQSLDILILDELGYVPASKAGSELLFDVISGAYERCSVIVTTNLPFEQWPEVLGSARLTGGGAGSIDASLPHSGGDRRELSIENGQKENQGEGNRMIA